MKDDVCDHDILTHVDDAEHVRQEELAVQRIVEAQLAREKAENETMAQVERHQRRMEARIRKLELGLDPNEVYKPVIVDQPQSVVTLIGERAFLKMKGENILTYRWTSLRTASLPLNDRSGFIAGAQSPMLRLLKVNQEHFGSYVCTARNDDGVEQTIPVSVSKGKMFSKSCVLTDSRMV